MAGWPMKCITPSIHHIPQNLEAIKNAVKFGGVNNEYIIFDPAASIAVFQYKNNGMPKNDVIELYNQLNEIADYNINNNASLSDYYSQAKENMNGTFAKIEDEIFDYTFFKEKFQPEYESDSDNPDVLKKIIRKLKEKNCPADDPFWFKLKPHGQNTPLKKMQKSMPSMLPTTLLTQQNICWKPANLEKPLPNMMKPLREKQMPMQRHSFTLPKPLYSFVS